MKVEFETKIDSLKVTDEDLIIQIDREYQNALDFRKARVADWHANEDMLYGAKPKTLSKRSNIDLRLMQGFENTLLSRLKNPPVVKFHHTEEADMRKAKKVTALWELESSPTRQNWKFKDLLSKKLALPSGRAITKIYATSPYKHYREEVDHYDFLIDPLAGGLDIENARYLGQDNIFKAKYDLLNNSKYEKGKVKELIESYSESPEPDVDNQYKEKANRFGILGLNIEQYNYSKDGLYKLLEWFTTINGQRWYVVASLEKKIILKKCLLEEVIGIHEEDGKPLYPFSSWAYFPDIFNFWSISPMDLVRENFQTRNITINQAIDNNEAKNKPMKSYDPKVYKKPALLEYRPDGLVPTESGTDPKAGLFIHPTADIYDPKALNDMLEDIAAKVTGVTPSAQGESSGDQKVGIYYGDMQEVGKRMSLFEDSYVNALNRMALLYLNGLKDHLDEEKAVKMIGEKGVEWDKLVKEDLREFDITIGGGTAEAENDAIKAKTKSEFFAKYINSPIFNQKVMAELDALNAGLEPAEVKRLLETEDIDQDLMSQAAEDIQKLLNGEKITPNMKADTKYMQKILDFMMKTEMKPEQDERFMAYLEQLKPMVIHNMVKKAQFELANQGALPVPNGMIPGGQPGEPQPNTLGGTNARASELTNSMKENYVEQPV